MKTIKIILLTVLFVSIIACDNNEEVNNDNISLLSIENFSKDERLVKYIKEESNLIRNIKNVSKIEELTSKQNLNNNDLLELSLAMGFSSFEEYRDYYISQQKILLSLKEDYNLSSYSQDEIKKSLISSNIQNLHQRGTDPCNCFRIARNTTIEIGAAAVVAHLGCATLDLTIIGGIICHGAVLVGQIAAEDNNDANLQNCLRDCENQI